MNEATDAFLEFLARDILVRPHAVRAMPANAPNRLCALVAGVNGNPDQDFTGAVPV